MNKPSDVNDYRIALAHCIRAAFKDVELPPNAEDLLQLMEQFLGDDAYSVPEHRLKYRINDCTKLAEFYQTSHLYENLNF